jgi:hypothetical protein
MKKIVTIAILFVFTCIVTGTALAQGEGVRAKVPFDFTVGSTTLPAGTYSIKSINNSAIIKIDNLSNTGDHVLTMSQAPSGKPAPVRTLVFHKWGTQYFLSDVRGDEYHMNLHFPTSKEEKRAKAEVAEAELHTSSTVLVALK